MPVHPADAVTAVRDDPESAEFVAEVVDDPFQGRLIRVVDWTHWPANPLWLDPDGARALAALLLARADEAQAAGQ